MDVEDKKNQHIENSFTEIDNMGDLNNILNYVKSLFYSHVKDSKPIQVKSLWYYSNPNWNYKSYTQFPIRKKDGSERIITAPVSELKLIQRCLNFVFNVLYEPHPGATGFLPNSNVVENAKIHIGKNYVYNVDIKDFFPSISFYRIKNVLQLEPFYLKEEIAFRVANICCYGGVLPQGAPTSPTLTNVVCQKLDRRLEGLSKRFGANYTRYVDDITFSSSHNLYQEGSKFILEMKRIIHDQKFRLNDRKTRLQKRGYRQEVTGLTVNEKPNLSRRYMRQVRAMLSNWEKRGLSNATAKFRKNYISDKGHVKSHNNEFVDVLSGKLEYMGMVRGKKDPLYQKYKEQFFRLVEGKSNGIIVNDNLKSILLTWEKEGIGDAMNKYYLQYG